MKKVVENNLINILFQSERANQINDWLFSFSNPTCFIFRLCKKINIYETYNLKMEQFFTASKFFNGKLQKG
jgi:hypothetical protein